MTLRSVDVKDVLVIKRGTGFLSFATVLSFALIVCDDGLNKMIANLTTLTWLEEWFKVY